MRSDASPVAILRLRPWLPLVAWFAAALAAPAQDAPEAEFVTRNFSIPDVRATQADWDAAEEHAQAGRHAEAAALWQKMIETGGATVLAGERKVDARGAESQQLVHAGAANAARQRLLSMPRSAREAYRLRHGAEASRKLAGALAACDEAALLAVAARWPLCDAAPRAAFAAGDLAYERGDAATAHDAWSLALGLAAGSARGPRDAEAWKAERARIASGADAAPGALARIDAALAWLAAPRSDDFAARGAALVGEGQAAGPTPGPEAGGAGSARRIASAQSDPLVRAPRNDGLWPCVAGETLLVNTGLRLLALSTWTGDLLWDSREPRGWESLSPKRRDDSFLGVDRQNLMVGACVSGQTAVAPLQLSYTRLPQQKFNNINITTPLPERRLFGFDLRTGRKLWSHEPAPGWDGESGSLVERASVAAPPTACGDRVLAPVVSMQGRIDYHVVCVDARDGSVLWSTNLVSGQRELNMFGRAEHEFSACPLVVHDGKVLALTQLGAIAALDLYTGEILWETLYERIELPRTQDFRAPSFRSQWRNAPPVVADGVLLATPFDSRDLVAVDIESGALLWSLAHATINRAAGAMSQLTTLVGADRTTIVLGGEMVAALDAPQGVATRGQLRLRWSREPGEDDEPFTGRATLARGRVVWPLREGRIELDLKTGETLLAAPWPDRQAAGNVLPLAGALVTVSHTHVQTIFDWEALVARARAALEGGTERDLRAMELSQLLDGRAEALAKAGRHEEARAMYEEARGLLEELPEPRRAAAAGRLYRMLRGEARVHAALAQPVRALQLLERARGLAADADDRRAVLLEELELSRRMRADTEGLLAALEACGGRLAVLYDAGTDALDELGRPGAALVDPSAEQLEAAELLPVDLYAALERLRAAEERKDDAACYDLLYGLLSNHFDSMLGGVRVQELCAARIARMLAAGRRGGFETHERAAREALERLGGDAGVEDVERLARLWPGTAAAGDAADRILDLAARSGDLARAAQITIAGLPPRFSVLDCDEAGARALARLAQVAERAGSPVYAAALVRALAARHPTLQVQLADATTTLGERAAALPRLGVDDPFDGAAAFSADARRVEAWGGLHEWLGRMVPAEPEEQWPADRPRNALFAQVLDNGGGDLVLRLLAEPEPTAPLWTQRIGQGELPGAGQNGVFGGRVFHFPGVSVLALRTRLVALRATDGELVWTRPVEAVGCAAADGVVVVRDMDARLSAFDCATGVPLWSEQDAQGLHAAAPLLGAGCALSMPAPGRRGVVVRDLCTGRLCARFELAAAASLGVERDAWIEAGRLLVPWFNEVRDPAKNQVALHSLPDGAQVGRIGFEEADGTKRVLNQVLTQEGRSWLLLRPWAGGTNNAAPQPLLVRVDAQRGELDQLSAHKLGFEDRVVGLTRFQRLEVAPGPVFVIGVRPNQPQREARLRAFDLSRGELWTAQTGIPYEEIQHGLQPCPVVSTQAALVALTQYDRKLPTPDFRARLLWFDATSGLPLGNRDLPAAEKGDSPVLVPLGGHLIVRTRTQLEILK